VPSRIAEINDPEALKQAALLLEHENARLHARLKDLIAENAKLNGKEAAQQLQLEIVRLQEQLALARQKMFGTSSEKRGAGAGDAAAKGKAGADRNPPGHGPRPQLELDVVPVPHDLPEDERRCPDCGLAICEWEGQTEDSEEITVVERVFVIKKHQRKKYRCKGGCAPVTAPAPLKLVEGGRYAIDFAIYVAIMKYLYHLPLERQVRMYAANGLTIDSQTLWDQIELLARHLEASYRALGPEIFKSPLIHADETHWKMLSGQSTKWFVWSVADHGAVFHRIFPSRSGATAKEVLAGYRGTVMADAYDAYQTARAGPAGTLLFNLVFCWAHVRRRFVKATPFAEAPCAGVLALIGNLYEIERDLPNPHALTGDEQADALDQIRAIRGERSVPVVAEIKAWASRQSALPESTFAKAIRYMLDNWTGLTAFLENPWAPLDNNLIERQIRGVVVGRKNHYGSKSRRGTEVAAIFYSLIETAQIRGEDPSAFLLRAATAAILNPGTATLPHSVD
jgi:transposase